MVANNGSKKSVRINVMVSLKSLFLCEALCKAMAREMNGYKMLAAPTLMPPANFRPNLILVDLANLQRSIFVRWPESKILLIDTGLSEEDTASLMCSYKLFGVISPEADFQQYRKALHVIQGGQIWIDNARLKAILHGKNEHSGGGMVDRLSKKEAQIVEHVAEGYKNKEIADMLYLSEQTIKSHLGRIFKKMNVTNRSQLVSLTIKNKFLNP
jgi:LuxR family transcriptional regulator, positive regulator of biofilm formation